MVFSYDFDDKVWKKLASIPHPPLQTDYLQSQNGFRKDTMTCASNQDKQRRM